MLGCWMRQDVKLHNLLFIHLLLPLLTYLLINQLFSNIIHSEQKCFFFF